MLVRHSIATVGLVSVLAAGACKSGEASDGTGGAGATANEGGNAGAGGDDSADTFEALRAELAREVADYETAVPFTLVLADDAGTFFEASNGASSASSTYESASTSKWVAAAVVLHVVETTELELDSSASEVLSFWTDDPADWRSAVTLRQLLSFTSGMQPEGSTSDATCINLPGADFASCVESLYDDAGSRTEEAGSEFLYGSHHLQVAGLMAMTALEVDTFSEAFADFQAGTGLFPTGAFDLPSLGNPRLAGGMHWSATEYMEFLRSLYLSELLAPELLRDLFLDHTPAGQVEIVESPAWTGLEETWHYALGNWLECPASDWQASCETLERHSSPGAYGAYPFIDFGQGYYGILARQGRLGSFREGLAIYRDLSPLIEELAASASSR